MKVQMKKRKINRKKKEEKVAKSPSKTN